MRISHEDSRMQFSNVVVGVLFAMCLTGVKKVSFGSRCVIVL